MYSAMEEVGMFKLVGRLFPRKTQFQIVSQTR